MLAKLALGNFAMRPLLRAAPAVREVADMTPQGIIDRLELRKPVFRQTAAYGHFGRDDVALPWEDTSRAEALKAAAGLAEPVVA